MSIYVTPFTGVWIEIHLQIPYHNLNCKVTPFTGVWIEIWKTGKAKIGYRSHPSRVCGLKSERPDSPGLQQCHTLHGCVD